MSTYRKVYSVPFVFVVLLTIFLLGIFLLSAFVPSSTIYGAEANGDEDIAIHDSTVPDRTTPQIQPRLTNTETESVHLPIVAVNGLSSQAEWTTAWWQWIEALNNEPLHGEGEVDCGLGQSGDIWFLAGTEGGPAVERRCPVPQDTTFMIPLFTAAWDNEAGENLTVPEKRIILDGLFSASEPGLLNSKICQLSSRVDGVPQTYVRLTSPPFQRRADPEAVADGYWFAIRPQAGAHEIHFTGALCDFDTNAPLMEVDVTYHLTIEAEEGFFARGGDFHISEPYDQ